MDIDAFACAVAYAELLRAQGKESIVVIPGTLNATVTPELAELGAFSTTPPEDHDGIVIVDVSNPKHFASFVSPDDVTEIFDHHSGFESFWHEKLGEKSRIDMIGACATLIFEAWERAGLADRIPEASAKLLAAAIASNTLNFQIDLTCERDHHAFAQCLYIGKIDGQWIAEYLATCDRIIAKDLESALRNDTKQEELPELGVVTIGQLELWDSGDLVRSSGEVIERVLGNRGAWFLNAPSIGDRINYLYSSHEPTRLALSATIGATWSGNVGTTKKLMLRKEILRDLHGLPKNP